MDDLGLGLNLGPMKMMTVDDRPEEDDFTAKVDLSAKPTAIVPVRKGRVWSEQQKAIFEMFRNKQSGHVTIIARAGSSKTTTSIEGGKYAPEHSVLYAAFGKDIAAELKEKIGTDTRCKAQTIHSMGCGITRTKRPELKIDKNISYNRTDRCITDFFARPENKWDEEGLKYLRDNNWHPVKILELVKQMKPYADCTEEIFDVAVEMSLASTPTRTTLSTDFYPPRVVRPLIDLVCEIVLMVLEMQFVDAMYGKGEIVIDFCDMIWLPVRCLWATPRYPLVVIDEAQDLCFTQIELARMVCNGRIFVVGDDRQAIYGWRGADSGALARMTDELKSTVMMLNTCYRCAKSIIRYAQRYCPDIQAWDESPEGQVKWIRAREMWKLVKPGCFIISRANAPIFGICLKLILNGVPAKMGGGDIGKKLLDILERVEGKGKNKVKFRDGKDMWERLIAYGVEEKASIEEMIRRKYTNAKEKVILAAIDSRVETLKDELGVFSVMLKQVGTPEAVKMRLRTMFEKDDENLEVKNDRSSYVFCCTVHKSKGLETNTAFVVADSLKTDTEEEVNICYVAVTRAQENLYMVRLKEKEEFSEQEDAQDITREWADARPSLQSEIEIVDGVIVDDEEYAQEYNHA